MMQGMLSRLEPTEIVTFQVPPDRRSDPRGGDFVVEGEVQALVH